MGDGPFGRAAGEIDHLLPSQSHLPDERRRQLLLLGLFQEARILLLVHIDEDGLRAGLLDLRDVRGEIHLTLFA